MEAFTASSNLASRRAQANLQANLQALRETQPWIDSSTLVIPETAAWLLGRDGELTAMLQGGWYAGCSVPRRAGEQMLRDVQLDSPTGCLLRPLHACHIEILLKKLRYQQALLVLQDDALDAALLLACEDLSQPLREHRLWLGLGPDWQTHLEKALQAVPGLPIPGQYLRTQHLPADTFAPLMSQANALFGRALQARQKLTSTGKMMRQRAAGEPWRVCVAVPSQFRLWDDLAGAFSQFRNADPQLVWQELDPDDPAHSSPLALTLESSGCDALLLANLGRSDLNAAIPSDKPILSFVSTFRIPAPSPAGGDGLLVVDPILRNRALEVGWKPEQVQVAGWPMLGVPPATSDVVAIIANTSAGVLPKSLQELSSMEVLCEHLRQQLEGSPSAMGDDPVAFLRRCARKLGIPDSGLDLASLVEHVLMPCYQQNLARMLYRAGVKLRIWGEGWGCCSDLASCYAGEIQSSEQLLAAVAECRVLVEDWPMRIATALHCAGRPVVRPEGKTRDEILRLIERPTCAATTVAPLSAGAVLALLER